MMKMIAMLLALHGSDRIECSALPHGPKLRLRMESESEYRNRDQDSNQN